MNAKFLSVLAVFCLTLFASFQSRADAYDDRARMAAERAAQTRAEARRRGYIRSNHAFLTHMRKSFATRLKASVTEIRCMDHSAYPKYTYQVCAGAFCVNVDTDKTTELDGSPMQGVGIASCRVSLSNGYACAVGASFVIKADDRIDIYHKKMSADCYDARGGHKSYNFGLVKM